MLDLAWLRRCWVTRFYSKHKVILPECSSNQYLRCILATTTLLTVFETKDVKYRGIRQRTSGPGENDPTYGVPSIPGYEDQGIRTCRRILPEPSRYPQTGTLTVQVARRKDFTLPQSIITIPNIEIIIHAYPAFAYFGPPRHAKECQPTVDEASIITNILIEYSLYSYSIIYLIYTCIHKYVYIYIAYTQTSKLYWQLFWPPD